MADLVFKAAPGRRIYHYEVPVDDQWHTRDLSGAILHVAARRIDVVEFWALAADGPGLSRSFRAFGTGHPLPDDDLLRHGTLATGRRRA